MRVSPRVAKLNGLPGFMKSRRKWTSANSEQNWLHQVEVAHRDPAAGENDVTFLQSLGEGPLERARGHPDRAQPRRLLPRPPEPPRSD